jgi:polysaccharide pyruvyl transferase WcaK-like protein
MVKKKVLVYGFYGKGNAGDDLFIEAYHYLFPDINFVFSETITIQTLQQVDAVFIGGGSFLLDKPEITPEALLSLQGKKIFYLGIGVEIDIHPIHLELMKLAVLIVTRSQDQVVRLQGINPRVRFLPDLVYALQNKIKILPKIDKTILIMPNMTVVPCRTEPHWKHAAWSYFKSEFAQFLDWLIENGYQPQFFSMCHNHEMNDDWVAAELIGHIEKRHQDLMLKDRPVGIAQTTALFSKYQTIITQRFHGIVLAEMTRIPYVAIHHHDKLKLCQPGEGIFISYYNSSKHSFIQSFNQALALNYSSVLPIESDIFKELVSTIMFLL